MKPRTRDFPFFAVWLIAFPVACAAYFLTIFLFFTVFSYDTAEALSLIAFFPVVLGVAILVSWIADRWWCRR